MKKYLVLLVTILTAITLVACQKDEEPPKIENKYYEASEQLLDKFYDNFWIKGANRIKAYYPEDTTPNSEYRGTAALWGYGAAMTAVSSGLAVNPNDPTLIARAHEIVTELEQYRYPTLKYRYYSAIVGGTGESYYDDNAWIVLALYEMALLLESEEYMTISREILDYVLSGESEDGGIYWKETTISRNTCSTGPAIIGALLHYQHSGDEELLETAIRLYDWSVDVLRDPSDFVYWDNAIRLSDGTEQVEYTKWTYNSGTMIWSSLLLFEITEEQKYLDDATKTTEGSYARFLNKDIQRDIEFFPPWPWFNVYLARGYSEYSRVTGDTKYIESFRKAADLALERGRDANGFIYPSWGSGSILSHYQFVSGLEQAGTIETLFVVAKYDIERQAATE